VLLGAFGPYPWAAAIAATGVIFAAAYLLWALQRIIYNKLDKQENTELADLSVREYFVLTPLLACILWIGLFPAPFLRRVEASVDHLITQVQVQTEASAVVTAEEQHP